MRGLEERILRDRFHTDNAYTTNPELQLFCRNCTFGEQFCCLSYADRFETSLVLSKIDASQSPDIVTLKDLEAP